MNLTVYSTTAVALYLLILLGPGLLICQFAGLKQDRFLYAFGFSISAVVFAQLTLRLLERGADHWSMTVVGSTLALGFLAKRLSGENTEIRDSRESIHQAHNFSKLLGVAIVVLLFLGYHLSVGAYTEIPSDFWAHLGRVSKQFQMIESASQVLGVGARGLFDDLVYVPFLHALIAHWVGLNPVELVTSATLATSLIFLCSFYFFAIKIQQNQKTCMVRKVAIAVLACVLIVLVLGVSSFSYVRYYAYFPHLLNMALFFVTLAVFTDFIESPQGRLKRALLLSMFLLVMGLVNKQEALFSVVMLISMFVVILAQRILLIGPYFRGLGIVFLFTVSGFISLALKSYPSVGSNPHLLDLGDWSARFSGWVIANPQLRVWESFGWFGVVVCLWIFLERRQFAAMPYVWAGLLIPFLTVFNPLFVGIFIREIGWDPLWRFALLVPVPFIAASLVMSALWPLDQPRRLISKVSNSIFLTLTLILIFPLKLGPVDNSESRIPSLFSVQNYNGVKLWDDLIRFLNTLDQREIVITDSVTNYVITTATQHQGLPNSKERWQQKYNYFNGDYRDKLEYYKRDHALLIVNLRDGKLSATGRISGHWPESILKVSDAYPDDLMDYLSSRPERYIPVFRADNIFVFRIKSGDQS